MTENTAEISKEESTCCACKAVIMDKLKWDSLVVLDTRDGKFKQIRRDGYYAELNKLVQTRKTKLLDALLPRESQ